jgi:hypothetical protein
MLNAHSTEANGEIQEGCDVVVSIASNHAL